MNTPRAPNLDTSRTGGASTRWEPSRTRPILIVVYASFFGFELGMCVGSRPMYSTPTAFPLGEAKHEAIYRGQPMAFWLAQLHDRDSSFRQEAIQALEQIGPTDAKVIPALAAMLNDPSTCVRLGAVCALRRLGADARTAVPSLILALADKDHYVRANTVYALGSITPPDENVIVALLRALKDITWLCVEHFSRSYGTLAPPVRTAHRRFVTHGTLLRRTPATKQANSSRLSPQAMISQPMSDSTSP